MSSLEDILGGILRVAREAADIVEPWHSFWYHRPHLNFPPPTIQQVGDYDGADRLSLACTQTALSASEQKRLVRSWCETLPTLAKVKYLWLPSRVPQELFEAVCSMPALEGLNIKWSGISSLASLAQLQTLKYLHLGSSPSATPLTVFGEMPSLLWLQIENVREASDLSFLRGCQQLRGLAVHGDSNSLKYLRLESLEPLRCLGQLEWLSIQTATVDDGALSPLVDLTSLKYLHISNKFKMEEVAALAGARPNIRCELFRPVGEPVSFTSCKKCKQKTLVMITGTGTKWLCIECDHERLRRHESSFFEIANHARAVAHQTVQG
jgi:hypothetical protein